MLVDGWDLFRDDHEADRDPTSREEARAPADESNCFVPVGWYFESFIEVVAVVFDIVDERGNDLGDLFEHWFSLGRFLL